MRHSLAILFLTLFLVACGGGKEEATTQDTKPAAAETKAAPKMPPPQVWLYESGAKKSEITQEAGEKDGAPVSITVVTRWYENGQMKQQSHVINGKQHGAEISWYENGQKSSEANYIDGALDGVIKKWTETGEEIPPAD